MIQKFEENRQKIKQFVETKSFDMFIMALICLNSVILGLMVVPAYNDNFGSLFQLIDKLCLAIFVVEMILKLCAFGKEFFALRWNRFDFAIVAISSFSFASPFIIFRAFRLFRILKYINRFSKLKRIVGISQALLPNFVAFFLVFSVFIYVFAIIAVNLFSDRFLDFASLPQAVLTLLQVCTLDGWAEITRAVMKVFPHAWIFFISFLMLGMMLCLSFVLSLVGEVIKRELFIQSKASRPYQKKFSGSKNGKNKQ